MEGCGGRILVRMSKQSRGWEEVIQEKEEEEDKYTDMAGREG